ncbi:MerR family transcriptional regulator [Caldalkalibacillus mannanilyticus]|uniref:MerR family transcriptional regulator n=1 Tax=Caldalkalibacillus mannanilyticus TaxID=1418 RepID=UPI00046A6D56|nr:MerR family transcriptional regulator [Caldalkalibacillus mannanilyticus]
MSYKVKEVAELAGISVRTLHHYDRIGLLKPDTVNSSGYRLYSDQDLEKLQQILFFKELGFSLQETKKILENPHFDRKQAFQTHLELLKKKRNRLEEMILSVTKTIQSIEGGVHMDKKEMFRAFDMSEVEKYAEEISKRYGNSEAYRESQEKTATYTKEDWREKMSQADKIYQKFASLMDKGAHDPKVQEAVSEWRAYITDNFYNCTPEILRGLGDMYVLDERFTTNIDQYKPGLALFLKDAITFYCDHVEK